MYLITGEYIILEHLPDSANPALSTTTPSTTAPSTTTPSITRPFSKYTPKSKAKEK